MAGASDLAHIGRLKEEEERALKDTEDQIQKHKKFDDDYTALKKKLSSLPDKVTHPVMVPFGKYAFMPGQLIHTNEIMVLLGDNWFAERSAKQACEIIERRKKHIQKMTEGLEQQKKLLADRLGFVRDMKETVEGKGDVVEIREEYDAEMEARWREERRAKKRESAAKAKASPSSSAEKKEDGRDREEDDGPESGRSIEEELLWERLDELEREEEELDEMAMLDEEEDDVKVSLQRDTPHHPPSDEGHSSQKHVHWSDQPSSSHLSLQLKDEDEEEEEDGSDEDSTSTSVIHFSHSQGSNKDLPKEDEEGSDISPRSPRDIYDLYQGSSSRTEKDADDDDEEEKPKSILKHPSTPPPSDEAPSVPQEVKPQPSPSPVSAFTGSIVEHSLTETSKPSNPDIQDQGQGSRRVSKFKAGRQGRR